MQARLGPLTAICLLALAARLLVAAWFPNTIHADETFQYLEQAYRVVTGRGLVPWEYRAGVRSWLLPGLVIPVIAAARAVSTAPAATAGAIALAASAASLAIVAAAHVLGRRAGGPAGGIAAALLVAFWPEIVLMSPHVLADSVAAIPLAAALAAGYHPEGGKRAGTGALVATGLLLALAGLLRPQLFPAAAVAGIWIARLDWRAYAAIAAGAVPEVAGFGLLDWLTWGAPFASVLGYLKVNGAGVAAAFGVTPFYQYAGQEVHIWTWGVLLIAATALAGVRRLPLVAVVALIVLATFSAVGHKENRFIYPALPLLFMLCGVGSVEIVRRARMRWPGLPAGSVPGALVALWFAAGATAAVGHQLRQKLYDSGNVLAAIAAINADPALCGVAVAPKTSWWATGAFRFRDDLPLYAPGPEPLAGAQAYNAVLLFADAPPERWQEAGFRRVACFPNGYGACVLTRPSPCRRDRGVPLETDLPGDVGAVLHRLGMLPR